MRFIRIRHAFRHRAIPLFLTLCACLSLLPSGVAFADANQLIVTPTSLQTYTGTQLPALSIKAYFDTNDTPNPSAIGTLTYSSNLLQIVSVSTASHEFSSTPSVTPGNGTIGFNASSSPTKVTAQIFTVTFKAIGAGTAVVGFSGDSRVNGVTTTYKSSVISISNPTPNPSTNPTPKPSTTPKPSVTPTPIVSTSPTPTPQPSEDAIQSTPDPTGVITNVLVKSLYNSATVTWTVNADNPSSTFRYGTKSSTLDQESPVQKNADGTFSATVNNLEPGNRYYFSVSGSGSNNKKGVYSSTIVANGYPVQITVTENDVPAKSAQIKIGTRTYTTGSNGKVTVSLAAGTYNATIRTETASLSVDIVVVKKTIPSDGSAPESQAFSYKLTSSPLAQGPGSQTSILTFVAALVIGTLVLGLGFFGFIAYRRRQFEGGGASYTSSGPTVIIDDGYQWHQDAPQSPAATPEPPSTITNSSYNSVHISDKEPVDMFEKPTEPPKNP